MRLYVFLIVCLMIPLSGLVSGCDEAPTKPLPKGNAIIKVDFKYVENSAKRVKTIQQSPDGAIFFESFDVLEDRSFNALREGHYYSVQVTGVPHPVQPGGEESTDLRDLNLVVKEMTEEEVAAAQVPPPAPPTPPAPTPIVPKIDLNKPIIPADK
jgi:hypothetical protein